MLEGTRDFFFNLINSYSMPVSQREYLHGYFFHPLLGLISPGVSVPVQVPGSEPDMSQYWPRLQ